MSLAFLPAPSLKKITLANTEFPSLYNTFPVITAPVEPTFKYSQNRATASEHASAAEGDK